MKINFLLIILLVIPLINLASSERVEPNYIYNGVINNSNDYNPGTTLLSNVVIISYICSSSTCTSVSSTFFGPVNIGNQNPYNITYPTILQSSGYLTYFFKEGYIPFVTYSNLWGTAPTPAQNDYLYQKQFCKSNVSNLVISGGDSSGNTLTISAKVYSAINNNGPSVYRPISYQNYFKNNVTSHLKIKNLETGQETNFNLSNLIDFSSYQDKIFTFTPLSAGNYSFNFSSSSTDVKCLFSISDSINQIIEIKSNTSTTPTTSLPIITINSPLNETYNTSSILINLSSINATNVWWSDGITIYSYTTPITYNFPNGTNTVYAYANNSAGTSSTQVTFYVNTSLPYIPTTSHKNNNCCCDDEEEEVIILEKSKKIITSGNNTIYFEESNIEKSTGIPYLVLFFILIGLILILILILLILFKR